MSDESAPKLSKVEKLQVAGAMAPAIRDATEGARTRKIKTTDASGNVVRIVSAIEIVEKQLLRAGIEIGAPKGERPKALRCKCGMPYLVAKKGGIPIMCGRCTLDRLRCQNIIDGKRCHRMFLARSLQPSKVSLVKGAMRLCRICSISKFSKKTDNERKEMVKKAWQTRGTGRCKRGHELDYEKTRSSGKTQRACRLCKRMAEKQRRAIAAMDGRCIYCRRNCTNRLCDICRDRRNAYRRSQYAAKMCTKMKRTS